ncbi:hypothetical protein [Rhodococcus ruber]
MRRWVAIVGMAGIMATVVACGEDTPVPTAVPASTTTKSAAQRAADIDREHRATAVQQCKTLVEGALYSPGSAQWGDLRVTVPGVDPALDAAASGVEGRVYDVTGYVDSQNRFGALLRLTFHCVASYREEGQRAFMNVQIIDYESSGDR